MLRDIAMHRLRAVLWRVCGISLWNREEAKRKEDRFGQSYARPVSIILSLRLLRIDETYLLNPTCG